MDTRVGDILVINQNVTLAKLQEPEQDREQCTLSESSTADDIHYGAGLDTSVDAPENGLLGAAGIGCLDILEDDLATRGPQAFSRVSR